IPAPDRVLPHFIKVQLVSPWPGLLVAAILAASMSTISAGINSLTASTLIDFFYAHDSLSHTAKVNLARVRQARYLAVAYGVIIILLALKVGQLGTLVEVSNTISGLFGGALLGVFFLGVGSTQANAPGALVGAA